MSNTKLQLRLNGYSANDAGIICALEGAHERFKHERTGILKIEISRNSKAARAIVDSIIAAIDEPRALVGRDKLGGAVVLFRLQMWVNTRRVELALRSGEQIAITIGAEGLTVEPDAFTWQEGFLAGPRMGDVPSRSPLNISRDALPPMFPEFFDTAQSVAETAGALPAKEIEQIRANEERVAKFRADVASGKVKLKSEAELADDAQARSDAEIVKEWQGQTVRPDDGGAARTVLAARARHAVRLAEKSAA